MSQAVQLARPLTMKSEGLRLPYVVLGGLWEHLRNAAERLWDDVSDIEWAAFTPSYWREHIKQ